MNRTVVLLPVWVWLLIFVVAPVLIVAALSFSTSVPGVPPFTPLGQNPDPANYQALTEDAYYLDAGLKSLLVAGVSSVACLLIGYPMALAIARAPERWRSGLLLLVMLPFWTGFLLRITAWIGLLRDDGWINLVLTGIGLPPVKLLYTDLAMYIGITYAYLPFMILPLYARLSRRDPALEEAAADLGATPWVTFRTVTLPLSLPGVVAGLALVFIPAVGEYVIPELLGGPGAQTIGRALWNEFFANRDWPMAAALANALLIVLLVPMVLMRTRE
ncbi:MAG: ABC transporter permease subunit [Acetobacteraceae bacterium]|nr:ABC transporter permease subunit [Acetobacteraceae bacterium]